MMKKLLILMLVLGLASAANAALVGVELSVNGVTDGSDNTTDVTLAVSTEVVIGVYGPAEYFYAAWLLIMADPVPLPTLAGGEWGDSLGPPYEVKCSSYYYELSGYPIKYPAAGDEFAMTRRIEWDDFGFGYELNVASFTTVPGGLQFEYVFHCCIPGVNVTVQLADMTDDAVADTIVFHQIPEPATMLLLGLGGLLLRRRK